MRHKNNPFLHNIYYHCVSSRKKKDILPHILRNLSITPHYSDARSTILNLKSTYDIVFLDAFTPTKLPTLWSYDFLAQIYKLLNTDGLLVTYTNSVAVRHALHDIGFNVGKIYDNQGKQCGTIASKSPDLILDKLNDYDLGLMLTNAGVYFRDETLNNTSFNIIEEWKARKISLNLPSSSSYIKKHKKIMEEKCTI